MKNKPKILVIVGPTSIGKSDLAVHLAKKFNGEVVSADSRQVYKGLDIGTGKITPAEMCGIPHHLVDIVSPKKKFSVSEYQKIATDKINNILERGKLPIICGGTGFYIQAVVDGIDLPEIEADQKLRKRLEKMSLSELQKKLQSLDPKRLKKIDQKNKVRLIRAIEIAEKLGKVPQIKKNIKYKAIIIGLYADREILDQKIRERLKKRLRRGLVKEVYDLHKNGLSWKRLEELGLEYRYISLFLRGIISRSQMLLELENKNIQYARRQMTWFKKDKRINWFKIR